jgi:hypothetical protein
MVLRTAASTSTARLRPASTAITTLRTGRSQDVLVQRLVGQALEFTLHRLLAHQVHDELQAHLAAHGGLAKDGLDVEQADAAHFQQVLQQRRAAAFQRRLADAVDVHRVVGHQAVAADISSSPSSLLPRPDSPVSSTPRPRMSMNTPWRVVRSAKAGPGRRAPRRSRGRPIRR